MSYLYSIQIVSSPLSILDGLIFIPGLKDIRKAQVKAATDRLTWAQSPTFLAGLTASILVADVLDDPESSSSIFTYTLCYLSLLMATLSATLSALAAVYMQQQQYVLLSVSEGF